MVSHKEKLELLDYYACGVCRCGSPKKNNRWLCMKCREKVVNTTEWKECGAACGAHVSAAKLMLDKVQPGVM